MSFVAVAIGGAAVIGAGATAYSASQASKSQRQANDANLQAARETNDLNYQLFREGRGEDGSSLLPLYATRNGRPFEPELFADTMAIYDATSALTPQQQYQRYQSVMEGLAPAQAGAVQTARGIFDGSLVNEAIANQQPVAQARTEAAGVRKNAGLESLQATLNEIKMIQRKKGFAGDSFGSNLVKFQARREANTMGAMDLAQAKLQNAQDESAIRQGGINTRINNLQAPYAMARNQIASLNAPEDALLDQQARRQQLFNAFRIGPSQFQYSPLPAVQPVASTGQIAGQAIAGIAGAGGNFAANYWLQQQQQKNTMEQLNAIKNPT